MRFFILSRPMKQRDLWFQAIEDIPAESYFLGEEVPREPVVFKRQKGSLALDLMGGTHFHERFVSQAFVDVLESNGFTGWSTYPVRLFGKDDQELPGYFGLAVTGRSGPLDKSKCRVVKSLRADGTEIVSLSDGSISRERIGWFIDPESWDGSDFFVPEGTSGICVTARAKEKLEAARLKGLAWTPNEEQWAGLLPGPPEPTGYVPPGTTPMEFFDLVPRRARQDDLCFKRANPIPNYRRYFRGKEVPGEPEVFKWQYGSRVQDVMGTMNHEMFVSQAFVDALESNGITGWSTWPVRLFGEDGQEIPGYHGLAVTGRSGPRDKSKCRVVKRFFEDGTEIVRPDGSSDRVRLGWFIDPGSWDGMDFFVPLGTRAICVTVAAKEKLEAAGLTGLRWTPHEEMYG